MLNSLSGRFLVLTFVFVMLAEVLIFVPSVARFRQDYFLLHLERAQIASLALEADDMITSNLEMELLQTAGVYNVVLSRDEIRQLALSKPVDGVIAATYDLRDPSWWVLISDALATLFQREDKIIRVIGTPVGSGGLEIEVAMELGPLRDEMLLYGRNILVLSAIISVITAGLLFIAVRGVLVKPISGVIRHMQDYAAAPEDNRRMIKPTSNIVELREAETALSELQSELTQALKQKQRLAQLGEGVAKISHDLRNILTSAQLFTDRIESVDDPTVRRLAPKLVGSITRAVSLCENALSFGKASEPPPKLSTVDLGDLVADILEAEELAAGDSAITFASTIAPKTEITADPEQLHRVITNLVRNARQAIMATGVHADISIAATARDAAWDITVADTGPGLPLKAREHLFRPFQGGVSKEGTGLGLAIASELVSGHGGTLELEQSDENGTRFLITLPKAEPEQQSAMHRS